jgi:hypothetical protein
MTSLMLTPETTAGSSDSVQATPSATNLGPSQAPAHPFILRDDQLYFWTHAWQVGEAESAADLASGETELFGDATSAIKWLFSAEE